MIFLAVSGSDTADANGEAFITTNPSNPVAGDAWLLSYVQIVGVPARSSMSVQITQGRNGNPIAPPATGAASGWSQVLLTGGQLVFAVTGMEAGDQLQITGSGVSGDIGEIAPLAAASPMNVFTLPAPAGDTPPAGSVPYPNHDNYIRLSNTLAVRDLITAVPGTQIFLYSISVMPINGPAARALVTNAVSGQDMIDVPSSVSATLQVWNYFGRRIVANVPDTPGGRTSIVQVANGSDVGTIWDYYAVWAQQ